MKIKNKFLLVNFLLVILLIGCGKSQKKAIDYSLTGNSTIIADTITVDVTLRATDSTSSWDVEQHRYINQKALVDYIFSGIYSDRFETFDFFTGKELSKEEIKKIETTQGFSRNQIIKIQFKEFWYVDTVGSLQKKILSYTLGLEHRSEQGTFLGYKALFTVKPK